MSREVSTRRKEARTGSKMKREKRVSTSCGTDFQGTTGERRSIASYPVRRRIEPLKQRFDNLEAMKSSESSRQHQITDVLEEAWR